MSQINFLPDSFNRARRRKQRRPVEFAVIGATALCLTAAWQFSAGPDGALAQQSERLDRDIEQVQQMQAEQQRLQAERTELQRRLQISRETYQPITVTQVFARLSELTPPPVRFVEFELETQRPDPEAMPDPSATTARVVTSAGASGSGAEAVPNLMRISVLGHAPSDQEVVALIRRLDEDPVFSSVALRSSRMSETDTHYVREFHLDIVVDLDRRFVGEPTQGGESDED